MKRKRLHIVLGSLLLLLLGGSMTFSTLHSHHHIQWHQTGDFADTGNCITTDVTVCPICAYLFKTELNAALEVEYHFNSFENIPDRADEFPFDTNYTSLKGRSPPFSV